MLPILDIIPVDLGIGTAFARSSENLARLVLLVLKLGQYFLARCMYPLILGASRGAEQREQRGGNASLGLGPGDIVF